LDYQSPAFVDCDARVRAHEAVSLRAEKFSEEAICLLAEEVLTRLTNRFSASPVLKADPPRSHDIEALADALVSSDPDASLNHVIDLHIKGVDRELIYLNYLAEAARLLGERWDADALSFTQVTLGAGRVYVILRALRPTFDSQGFPVVKGKTALFGATPGEDHVLGVTMAADMLRERGWTIDLETNSSHEELVQSASERNYPIIGLSASSQQAILPLTRLIASLRIVSPTSYILVSGELTALKEDVGKLVDADFIAHDAPEAIKEMQRLETSLVAS